MSQAEEGTSTVHLLPREKPKRHKTGKLRLTANPQHQSTGLLRPMLKRRKPQATKKYSTWFREARQRPQSAKPQRDYVTDGDGNTVAVLPPGRKKLPVPACDFCDDKCSHNFKVLRRLGFMPNESMNSILRCKSHLEAHKNGYWNESQDGTVLICTPLSLEESDLMNNYRDKPVTNYDFWKRVNTAIAHSEVYILEDMENGERFVLGKQKRLKRRANNMEFILHSLGRLPLAFIWWFRQMVLGKPSGVSFDDYIVDLDLGDDIYNGAEHLKDLLYNDRILDPRADDSDRGD